MSSTDKSKPPGCAEVDMGIHRFGYWFAERNEIINCLKYIPNNINTQIDEWIDWFAIDINVILHDICAAVVAKYIPITSSIVPLNEVDKNRINSINIPDSEFFASICDEIANLVRLVQPQIGLILCIDGTSGISKAHQQRQRRFMTSQNQLDYMRRIFDTNKLSCGTVFMQDLCIYMADFIQGQLQNNNWSGLEIIFSPHTNKGEGEHKAVRLLESKLKEEYSCMVYSSDADVAVLMMTLGSNELYILKKNIFKRYDAANKVILNVAKMRQYFVNRISGDDCHELEFQVQMSHDLTYIFSLFGNDFVPSTIVCQISRGGMDFVLDSYQKYYVKYGGDFIIRRMGKRIFASKKRLCCFLEFLKQYEDEFLLDYMEVKGFNDLEKYKQNWYSQKLNITNRDSIVQSYINALNFIADYYIDGMKNWQFSYAYYYAPFIADIVDYLKNIKTTSYFCLTQIETESLSPLQQLFMVLPQTSANLLPKSLEEIVLNPPDSLLAAYNFVIEMDFEDKIGEHEHVIKIPFTVWQQFQPHFAVAEKFFDNAAKIRNKSDGNAIYLKIPFCV